MDTTLEGVNRQPDKLAKQQFASDQITKEETSNRNRLVQRTLNLKICLPFRPLSSNEMQIIKKFLRYQIEQALENKAKFIPIFTEPCKIEKDGVHVFCSDQTCAEWVKFIAITGIPEIVGKLTVLPQETPLKFGPEFVSVRVVTCIPTKKPKDQILDNMAQLNKDLNTEKWQITKIRPKGPTSSTVFMRMDARPFDTICARNNNRINCILGPITIRKEEHKQSKKPNPNPDPQSAKDTTTARSNFAIQTTFNKKCGWHT